MKKARRDLIIGGILILPLLVSTLAEYLEWGWKLSGWVQLLLATLIQLWLGAQFYRGAWSAVRKGRGNMDLLVAVGTSAALGLSLYHFYLYGDEAGANGRGHLHFDGAALIIMLVMLGKYLEMRARYQTMAAIGGGQNVETMECHQRVLDWAPAPIQGLADKVSAFFVPFVLILSVLTLLGWYGTTGNFEKGLLHSVAVLVIACPCALGLATPLSLLVGKGAAARAGIMFRDDVSMEKSQGITALVFEKNAGLTESRPHIAVVLPHMLTEEELIQSAAAILSGRDHPLARALARRAEDDRFVVAGDSHVSVRLGKGWRGLAAGRSILIGYREFMHEYGIDLSPLSLRSRECEIQGYTLFFIADQNSRTLLGALALSERVKRAAFDTVQELHAMGVRTILLTSDHKASAFRTARALGIDEIHAQATSESRRKIIGDLVLRGESVALMGNSTQDASAAAEAHVSITFAGAEDGGLQAAGITLLPDDPHLIADALHISRRTFAKIHQNLAWALVYNLIGISLAASGLLGPATAAFAMALSSLGLMINARRLGRWRLEERAYPGKSGEHRGVTYGD